jgi:peptidoglycan/LPS O-acetylase OafA/YrhL
MNIKRQFVDIDLMKDRRFVGIDLMKGFAAYAVVWVHSSGGLSRSSSDWVTIINSFCNGFAVPFFLATSFLFITKKVFFISGTIYWFKLRVKFLLMPYLVWTTIYSIFRIGKYLLTGDTEKLNAFFTDPVSVIVLGGAGVQLYYLPLLISGVISIFCLEQILLKSNLRIGSLVLLIFISTLIYQLIIISGNGFQLGPNVAFQHLINTMIPSFDRNQIVRVLLVIISWSLRCVPYIFTAILLNHPLISKQVFRFNITSTIIFGLAFIIVNTVSAYGIPIFPSFVTELVVAYASLLFALSLSNQLSENELIFQIGSSSFGIYLIHHLLIDFVRPFVSKIYPSATPLVAILLCATTSFFLSWASVSYLSKHRKIKSLLFSG